MTAQINLNNIAIMATIDEEGNLGKVGSIEKKLESLKSCNKLQLCYVSSNQDNRDWKGIENRHFDIRPKATLKSVLEDIDQWFGPQQCLRNAAVNIYNKINFIGREESGGDDEFINRIFQELYLVKPLDVNEKRKSYSEPGYIRKMISINGQRKTVDGKIITLEQLLLEQFSGSDRAPRIILFGEQGSGKSVYLKYIGKNLAERKLPYKKWVETYYETNYLPPLIFDSSEWLKSKEKDIYNFILEKFDCGSGLSEEKLKSWISHGDLFILIDHIERAIEDNNKYKGIIELINLGKTCPVLMTCNLSLYNSKDLLKLGYPKRVYLSSLSELNRRAFIRGYFEDFEDLIDPVDVINQIDALLEQNSLSQNPLLLSLLCLIANRAIQSDEDIPNNRSQLFDALVKAVTENCFGINAKESKDISDMLSLLAFAMIKCEINDGCSLDYEGARTEFDTYKDYSLDKLKLYNKELKHIFLENIRGNSIAPFRDKSFKYYFAARWIAKKLEGQEQLKDNDLIVLVNNLSENPDYQELVVFLAGWYRDIINHFTDGSKMDDLFLHHTALAARCIREIDLNDNRVSEAIDQVSESVFEFFFYEEDRIVKQCDHIIHAAVCLTQKDVNYKDKPISEFITFFLVNEDIRPRIETLFSFFRHHEPPQIITEILIEYLYEGIKEKQIALDYIKCLGASLCKNTDLINRLIEFLKTGTDTELVLNIFTRMGKGVTEKEQLAKNFIDKLTQINKSLQDDNEDIRDSAIAELQKGLLGTLGSLGICQDDPELTELMFNLLGKENLGVERIHVAMALAETDLSAYSKDQQRVFVETMGLFNRSSNSKLRFESGYVLDRALQNTRELSLRNPLIEFIHKNSIPSGSQCQPDLIKQHRSNIQTLLKAYDASRLKEYWFSLPHNERFEVLSDRRTGQALLKWLCSESEVSRMAVKDILRKEELPKLPEKLVENLITSYSWGRPIPELCMTVLSTLGEHVEHIDYSRVLPFINIRKQMDEVLRASLNSGGGGAAEKNKAALMSNELRASLKFIQSIPAFTNNNAPRLLETLAHLLEQSSQALNDDLYQEIVSTLLRVLFVVVVTPLDFDEEDLIDYAYLIASAVRKNPQFPFVDEMVSLDEIGFRFYPEKDVNWKVVNIVTFREKLTITFIGSLTKK